METSKETKRIARTALYRKTLNEKLGKVPVLQANREANKVADEAYPWRDLLSQND